MSLSKRTFGCGLLLLLAVALLGLAVFLWQHRRVSPTDSYFTQLQDGRINADVEKTLALIAPFLASPPDDFSAFSGFPVLGFKYSIAFTAYGLANVAIIQPSLRPQTVKGIDSLIQKMLAEPTWVDWRGQGWGECPLDPDNIMWKGHLNLMYALHMALSGKDTYAPHFHKLSTLIAREMAASDFKAARCELINYYFQCNTVSMLSLTFHDKFYGTHFREQLEEPWLQWARSHMVVTAEHIRAREREAEAAKKAGVSSNIGPWPASAKGIIYACYHPNSKRMDNLLSGYTNAWSINFLRFFDPEWARQIYESSYKPTFVHKILWLAYAEEVPGKGMDGLATLFATFAAKAMDDRELFSELLDLFALAGEEKFSSANPEFAQVGEVMIDFPTSVAIQGPLLYGKTDVGWDKLLAQAQPRAGPPPDDAVSPSELWPPLCPGAGSLIALR